MPTRIRNISDMSTSTQMIKRPDKFGISDITKLMIPVESLPMGIKRGRTSDVVKVQMYSHLLENMNQAYYISVPFTTRKDAMNFAQSLYTRARKDGLYLSRRILQDQVKADTWNLWVELSR